MNNELLDILKMNIGIPLSPEAAADILMAANRLPALVPLEALEGIPLCLAENGSVFARERIADIVEEIRPLHQAHWNETEGHRHGLAFDPGYAAFIRYEQAGRYVLFTLRQQDRLLGNCALYLDRSAHTQSLIATEDTLFLLPEARIGTTARRFVAYVEDALRLLGVREVEISVKTVNRAERFFRFLGYRRVETGLTKILEADNV
ncbi:hypothetical protein SAMN05216414_106116 [Nitrosovibrio sp. Nv17]|nr:hypothetical protein SAMN05216414_106116 [Nitrosovibrio sp. Nv17]